MEKDNKLLSMEALTWLHSINYKEKDHEERVLLIKAAKIAYPEQ